MRHMALAAPLLMCVVVHRLHPLPCSSLVSVRPHLIHGQRHDLEEAGLALLNAGLRAVHKRRDGLTQRPLTVALQKQLLRGNKGRGSRGRG